MANRRHNQQTPPSRGADRKPAMGSPGVRAKERMPLKAAAWPGLPGGTQPRDRSNGVPKRGHAGPFHLNPKGL